MKLVCISKVLRVVSHPVEKMCSVGCWGIRGQGTDLLSHIQQCVKHRKIGWQQLTYWC